MCDTYYDVLLLMVHLLGVPENVTCKKIQALGIAVIG